MVSAYMLLVVQNEDSDGLLLGNLWIGAVDLVLSVISVSSRRVFLFLYLCWNILKLRIWSTLIVDFPRKLKKKKTLIAHQEALIIWGPISSLFLHIDTSDPNWPVTRQNSTQPHTQNYTLLLLLFIFLKIMHR